jgi:HPt (histidine-containing phosphotransfer) domain-containing protein
LGKEQENKQINLELLNKSSKEIKEIIDDELKKATIELGIDEKTIYELFEEFLTQLKDEKSIFYTALKNKDYKTLHEISHKLKGVLLNLRINQLGEVFTNLDNMIKQNKDINKIEEIINKIYTAFDPILNNKKQLKIEIDMPDKDLKIRLISLNTVLDNLKNKDFEEIISTLNSIYKKLPFSQFRETIDTSNKDNIKEQIEKLQNIITKEIS